MLSTVKSIVILLLLLPFGTISIQNDSLNIEINTAFNELDKVQHQLKGQLNETIFNVHENNERKTENDTWKYKGE
jgi:hypothetical protein